MNFYFCLLAFLFFLPFKDDSMILCAPSYHHAPLIPSWVPTRSEVLLASHKLHVRSLSVPPQLHRRSTECQESSVRVGKTIWYDRDRLSQDSRGQIHVHCSIFPFPTHFFLFSLSLLSSALCPTLSCVRRQGLPWKARKARQLCPCILGYFIEFRAFCFCHNPAHNY